MRRRFPLVVALGTLALAACSDQTPTEPTVPPPAEHFGSSCSVTPFPLGGVNGIANQIKAIYPGTQRAQVLLRVEALLRAGAIKLLWDTCHPDAARKVAFAFIDWLNRHTPVGKEDQVKALILAILRGIGEVTAPESSGDFGVGFFDPANPDKTLVKTVNEHALVELEAQSFLVPTVIVISREAGDPPLTGFEGRQFPPTYDYNAINSTNNHVLQPGKTAIVAFCLLFLGDEEDPGSGYPPNLRIGHNPVVGAPGFPFEILDPIDLGGEGGLRDELQCPAGTLGSLGGRPSGFANAALRTAGRYLGPILLPPPLWATALGPLPPPPPIGGKARSLSPFRVVEAPDDITINFDFGPDGETSVPAGTVVNTLYAPLGVTFQHAGTGATCGSTNVYANSNQPSGFGSSPNVVSLCNQGTASDISENTFGLIRANLATAAERVCIGVDPVDSDEVEGFHFARLDAFNAAGTLIGSSSSAPGARQRLCFAEPGIRRVEFSGDTENFARFDDLEVFYTFSD
jgi:hypothetical protein